MWSHTEEKDTENCETCSNSLTETLAPSNATKASFQDASELLLNVFDYELSASGIALGSKGKIKAGPISQEVKLAGVSIEGTNNSNGLELVSEVASAGISGSLSEVDVNLAVSGLKNNITIDSGKIKNSSVDFLPIKANTNINEANFNLNSSNSAIIGGSYSISYLKVGFSVNLGNASKGIGKLLETTFSYFTDLNK